MNVSTMTVPTELLRCSKCKRHLPPHEFVRDFSKWRKRQYGRWCKQCRKTYYYQTRGRAQRQSRETHLIDRYGITHEDYLELEKQQDGLCAICKSPPVGKVRGGTAKYFHVDHNHTTNAVRGLLCYRCNAGIGLFRENAKTMKAAIAYLEKRA